MSTAVPETGTDNPDDIIEGTEPHKLNFVGKFATFDLRRKGGRITEESGRIIAQRWLGFTKRGRIPEYEVTIQGTTGRSVFARVTRDHVRTLCD